MNLRKMTWFGMIASFAITPIAWGQPALPGASTAAAGIGPTTTAAAAPSTPSNLWSFLLPTPAQCAACKTCFCNSALGQMVSGAAGPMTAMSGGLIPNRCAQNAIANSLAQPADSSEGAAGRIKKDEADAKARRDAVRYLGTVDCSRWPEAAAALAKALRLDRNECVRFEAALALRNGCCCATITVDAMTNCVLGENRKDGFPIEKSERVRAAAAEALARCPMPAPIEGDKTDNKIQKTDARPIVDPNEYYQRVAQQPREQVLAGARAVLVSLQQGGTAQTAGANAGAAPAASVPAIHQRPAGLVGLVTSAFSPEAVPAANNSTVQAQSRQPFFTNLTKTLTGKQDGVVAARGETIVPAQTPPTPNREMKTVLPAAGLPAPVRTETKLAPPTEVRPPLPPSDMPLSQPRESIGAVEIEVVPAPTSGSLPPINLPAPPRP